MSKDMTYSFRNDVFLFTSIGTISYFVSRLIHKELVHFRDANEIKEPEKGQDLVGKEAEDSIKISTLDTLIHDITSREVKTAAIKLGVERFLRNPYAYNKLLRDVVCDDVQRQEAALRALRYLSTMSCNREVAASRDRKLESLKTMSALMTCLCNFLPPHPLPPTKGSKPSHRLSRAEADALLIIRKLVCDTGLTTALRAGLVSRWLKDYPFGDTPAQSIKDTVRSTDSVDGPDENFVGILRTLGANPEGKRAMRAAGLVGSSIGEETDEIDNLDEPSFTRWEINPDGHLRYADDRMMDGMRETTQDGNRRAAGGNPPWSDGGPAITSEQSEYLDAIRADPTMDLAAQNARRARAQRFGQLVQEQHSRIAQRHYQREQSSPEQAAVRRRRREAMVFHEGGSPISRDDIFQRRMTGETLGPERVQDPLEGRAARERTRRLREAIRTRENGSRHRQARWSEEQRRRSMEAVWTRRQGDEDARGPVRWDEFVREMRDSGVE